MHTLILLRGNSGSGKTTLAKALQDAMETILRDVASGEKSYSKGETA